MKTSEEKKLSGLLDFYMQFGFDHSVEEVAAYLAVTPKTLYNRYQSKDKMELSAMLYWQRQMRVSIEEKSLQANNCVEALLLVIYLIKELPYNAPHLFMRKMEDLLGINKFGNEEMRTLVLSILQKGKEERSIRTHLNIHTYEPYFLFNTYTFTYRNHISSDFVYYVLEPALTEKGNRMLAAINVESYLFNRYVFPVFER